MRSVILPLVLGLATAALVACGGSDASEETNGVPIESEVRWPRGGRSLYVRDPAGNSVEIASPALWGFPR